MARTGHGSRGWQRGILLCLGCFAAAQTEPVPALNVSGHITVGGQSLPYLIRHLPASSFPDLPAAVRAELDSRGCIIPQTYEAHRPENVIHASLERPGTSDWAVLCSLNGTTSLLVFFGSAPTQPFVLASAPETEQLQLNTATGVMGFNWAIDPASPQRIHEAQTGLVPRPPIIDHDALADSTVDRRTIYHFYAKGGWTHLDIPVD